MGTLTLMGAGPEAGGAVTYLASVLADSPLLYWRLGESAGPTAADTSGNGRTGTYGSGIGFSQAGALPSDANTAVSGNDTANAVVTSAFNPFVAASQRTFEVWPKRTATTNADDIWSGTGANPPVLECAAAATDVIWYPAGAATVTWAGALATGSYKHLVLTVDDSTKTAELFIDTVSQGTRVAADAYGAAPGNFQLGRAGASFWNGNWDELAIYSGILSTARISAHFAAR